jgi:glycosyltransferase involved in cell wall biosynthesis
VVKRAVFAVPGDLATPTGGYGYDRRIVSELGPLGWQVEVLNLGDGFPFPTAQVLDQAGKQLAMLPPGQPIVVDGLAFGVMPEAAEVVGRSYPLVALVHHPLGLETGLSAANAAVLCASEKRALAQAKHVITTSPATARLLAADFGVPADRLTVVMPGTDRVSPQPRTGNGPVMLLAVGTVIPRKGYDVLVAALDKLADLPWRLIIVGDRERSPDTTRQLDAAIARLDLRDRISFTGAVGSERLPQLYASADLFVLASRFEGYGMAYAEAVAQGLPVVGTSAGAIPDTVPQGAGVLVPPDDAEALAAALRPLIADRAQRDALAAGARKAAASLPTWRDSALRFAQVLDRLG